MKMKKREPIPYDGPNQVLMVLDGRDPEWEARQAARQSVVLTFKDAGQPSDPPFFIRLRKLLKISLRQLKLKCTDHRTPDETSKPAKSRNEPEPQSVLD